jgi:hypothetical protein
MMMSKNTLTNTLTYIILFGIIIICLYYHSYYKKNEESFMMIKPGAPGELKVIVESLDTIIITWVNTYDPSEDPINGHIVMLSSLNNTTDGSFLSFSNKTRCDPMCQYRLSNLHLEEGVEYKVSVMALNKSGSSEPSLPLTFKATPEPTPSVQPVLGATPAPTPAFLEDVIERQTPKQNVDKHLDDMVARAEGIFELNNNKLQYADVELSIKDQLQALNQNLLDDLVSNRINIHLEVKK